MYRPTRETGRQEVRRLEGERREHLSYDAIDAQYARQKAQAEGEWASFNAVLNALECGQVPDANELEGAELWIERMNGNVPHWIKWEDREPYVRRERMVKAHLRELSRVLKVG